MRGFRAPLAVLAAAGAAARIVYRHASELAMAVLAAVALDALLRQAGRGRRQTAITSSD